MGLSLKNPFVAAASPMSEKLDNLRKLEDAQISAIVMHSLFEEQIVHEQMALHTHLEAGTESFAESLTYFPKLENYRLGPEEYLELLAKAKKALSIPVIASLNGYTMGGWIDYAQKMQNAGADAIECNVYYIITDSKESETNIHKRYIDILKALKKAVTIPVAIKLSPYFTNIPRMAKNLDKAGADALVLFNRFYQPDIDLDALDVRPHLVYSTSFESRLALRWIAILFGKVKTDLAATGGVHTAEDAIKLILAGADVVQLCSVILQNGIGKVTELVHKMNAWMDEKEYESVEQMKGSISQKSCPDPAAFERANYMKTLLC